MTLFLAGEKLTQDQYNSSQAYSISGDQRCSKALKSQGTWIKIWALMTDQRNQALLEYYSNSIVVKQGFRITFPDVIY